MALPINGVLIEILRNYAFKHIFILQFHASEILGFSIINCNFAIKIQESSMYLPLSSLHNLTFKLYESISQYDT